MMDDTRPLIIVEYRRVPAVFNPVSNQNAADIALVFAQRGYNVHIMPVGWRPPFGSEWGDPAPQVDPFAV